LEVLIRLVHLLLQFLGELDAASLDVIKVSLHMGVLRTLLTIKIKGKKLSLHAVSHLNPYAILFTVKDVKGARARVFTEGEFCDESRS
jgi:hypothetical protein